MSNKSDVEMFYDAIAAKMGVTLTWYQLNIMEQQQFIQGLNFIMGVMNEAKTATEGEPV